MDSENKMILASRERSLLGEDIRYILFARDGERVTFCVTVEYGDDSETIPLGTSLAEATEIFCTLAEGNVTPCTLADVVADLLYLSAIC